jgi:hypothetical protein
MRLFDQDFAASLQEGRAPQVSNDLPDPEKLVVLRN